MAEKLHVTLRKKLNNILNKTLSHLFSRNHNAEPIEIDNIQRILVVRINYRIGNILFTTPLLNALAKQFPNVQIDMMLGAPFIASLIEEMPIINKVYSFDRNLLKHPLKILKLRKEINQNSYDVMILPSGLSSSDTAISWLLNAQYKIGFYDENSFKNLTHTVSVLPGLKHEALVPLSIMQKFGVSDIGIFKQSLDLRLTDVEKMQNEKNISSSTIGIFRDARGDKKIEDQWWKSLLEALSQMDGSLNFIDILDPNNHLPLDENIQTLSEKNLRKLARDISHLRAFICADTGPMHLASAAQTPTIALFKTTAPTLYGTLGKNDLSLEIGQKNIDEIAKNILEHLDMIKG